MNQNDKNNFLDSKTIMAIVLVGLVWFGWQSYLNKKYPAQITADQPLGQTSDTNNVNNSTQSVVTKIPNVNLDSISPADEKVLNYENDFLTMEVSSIGMSLKNINLKKYSDRNLKPIFFNDKINNFQTSLGSKAISFELQKLDNNTITGIYRDTQVQVSKKIFIHDYTIKTEIEISKLSEADVNSIPEIQISINDFKRVTKASSFLSPSLETQDVYFLHSEGNKTEDLFVGDKSVNLIQPKINVVSLNSHYFSTAIIDSSELMPDFILNQTPTDEFVKGTLTYKPLSSADKSIKLNYLAFIGPKDLTILESVDSKLSNVINFGMFSSIAKPMLLTMKWFYKIFNNWGLAIILLTLLVRMIVMPLHIMSFKSMKTMQSIQPMIQSIREKYKDDPMQLNRETMDLMKRNKVNPLSGCLPMLLQIPVFFALYRVFGQSIELYKAPFIFWIKDLSVLDPFYVLPVLLAIVMYLQQKMTPTTMDPAQAKIMQFMPLIFSLMMISLPSALTLYIFVSTLFGIIQQFFILKDKNKIETTNQIKAKV